MVEPSLVRMHHDRRSCQASHERGFDGFAGPHGYQAGMSPQSFSSRYSRIQPVSNAANDKNIIML